MMCVMRVKCSPAREPAMLGLDLDLQASELVVDVGIGGLSLTEVVGKEGLWSFGRSRAMRRQWRGHAYGRVCWRKES